MTFSSVVAGIREFLVWNFHELEFLVTSIAEGLAKAIAAGLGLFFFVGCWVLAGQTFFALGKWIFGVV